MHRYHLLRALQAASPSAVEERSLLTGLLSMLAAVALAVVNETPGGPARFMGLAGLAAVAVCAASRGIRLYRAGMTASLPTSVARVRMRIRPARGLSAITVTFALVFPAAVAVAGLTLVDWAWLPLSVVLLLGASAGLVPWLHSLVDRCYPEPPPRVRELLDRLCMRADMSAPALVVEGGAVASAWTARGRIHLTMAVLDILDDAELEAVLAHEVAHLARRDAAVMDICSAPSRLLLAFAGSQLARLRRWTVVLLDAPPSGAAIAIATIWIVGLLLIPPALVVGWISRLSVLGMSRARELSADAAAAMLTGRPSALASALRKLDNQLERAPRADLREVYANAVVSIVGTTGSGVGRLFATHPPTATRVKRLEELERRLQAGPWTERR